MAATKTEADVVRFGEVNRRLDRIDTTLDRVTAAFEKSSELSARAEERALAHAATDSTFYAKVDGHGSVLSSLTAAVGPLVEMRKWLIAAVIGVLGIFVTGGTTLYVNYIGRQEARVDAAKAAVALPIAAKKIEDALAAPQAERDAKQ